jgi:DNA-binding beta-propeller fold protein YncE
MSEFEESPRVDLTCSSLAAEVPWLTSSSTPQEVIREPSGEQGPLEYVDSIGKQNLPGQLDIIGSAVGTLNGNLLVADISNDRLQQFALDGTVLDAFPLLGSSPYGMAFLPNGNLVIANSRLNTVEIRTLEGELMQSIDGWPPPESDYISSRDEIDLLAVGLDDKIYTGEKWGNRVIILNNVGSLLEIWSGPDDNQFEMISDIATDSLGNLFVVDGIHGQVIKRSPNGEIREFTIDGSNVAPRPDGSFYISYDSSINLYDSDGEQLKQFEIGGYIEDVILAPDGSGVIIKSDIEELSDAALHFYDEDGKLVASFGTTQPLPGQFGSHIAFSVSSAGDVWVVDSGNSLNFGTGQKHLVHLDETYSHLNTFNQIDGKELTCHDYFLAALANQTVFIADPCIGAITLVDAEGQVMEQWDEKGLESGQVNLISDIALAPNERSIYLTDMGNNRLTQFGFGGEFIEEWDSNQLGVQMPVAVDISTDGTFFLIDGATFEVVIRPQQGPPLKWMLPITYESPHDIAIDENSQRIYVGDTDVNLYTYDWNGNYLGYLNFYDSSGVMVNVGSNGLVYRSAGFQEIQVFKPIEIANE